MAIDLTKKELLELLNIALRENEQLQHNAKSNERELLKAWEQNEELKDQVTGFAEMMGLSVEGSSDMVYPDLEDQLGIPDSEWDVEEYDVLLINFPDDDLFEDDEVVILIELEDESDFLAPPSDEVEIWKEIVAEQVQGVAHLRKVVSSLEESLACGMKHQEGLREDLSETQIANQNLVEEIDDSEDRLQQMCISADIDHKAISRLEAEKEALDLQVEQLQKLLKAAEKKAKKQKSKAKSLKRELLIADMEVEAYQTGELDADHVKKVLKKAKSEEERVPKKKRKTKKPSKKKKKWLFEDNFISWEEQLWKGTDILSAPFCTFYEKILHRKSLLSLW